MLSWLNLHDRPAVQVESLLALTNIAELCAQQSYSPAMAAAAAVPSFQEAMEAANKLTNSKFPYSSLVAPAPGSVPFPPLSFSQTLSPEAVAAFDASLTKSIDGPSDGKKDAATTQKGSSWPSLPNSLFPSAGLPTTASGAINFTSLAPPPGGAHSNVPSSAFLPPPTPVANPNSSTTFPQQLSASSQHMLLRHADAIPTLISLLVSTSAQVYEQAMWILGSIAAGDASTSPALASAAATGDNKPVSSRDVILAAGVMNPMLRCLQSHPTNLSLQRIGSWTLSNLVDGIFQHAGAPKKGSRGSTNNANTADYSSADEVDMVSLLPVLQRLLNMSDSEVLSYTCWTLSHLCDGPSSHIAAVVSATNHDNGLVPRLVELLLHPSWRVTKPALRAIGNIVCAECSDNDATDYTEVILDCNAVPRLQELITHSNREIQKEACWTLSNIAAGTIEQIQAVIDSGAIPPLVELVQNKRTDQEVRSEACWVVLNATSCGSDSQIEVLVDEGCVAVLGVLLSEANMVMMALEGLERVLQVEETRLRPPVVSADLISAARASHHSSTVIKRADRIWKQHFVSCALCHESFSKHRTADASFCEECKCYVCKNCNCRIYHLDYQEELWAASEEKTEQKKNAKKSKNKKKKEKLKQKKAKQQQEPEREKVSPEPDADRSDKKNHEVKKEAGFDDDYVDPKIDFVLYLQQTGSIIALAKLMDALEFAGEDYDEELDDYERKMIREQQQLLKSS